MRYDKFVNRMQKALKTKRFISKNKIIIMISCAIVLLLTLSYLFTSGVVVDVNIPEEFVYGEELEVKGNALFKKVTYEYRLEGSDEWTDVQPTASGKYEVRAVAEKIIGGKSYSDPVEFVIKPKEVEVSVVSATLEFGQKPNITADLEEGDHFVYADFAYDNYASSTTSASVIIESIIVHNKAGEEVTSSYTFVNKSAEVKFTSKTLNVKAADATKVYDGTPLTSKDAEVVGNSLVEGHEVILTTEGSITDVGSAENNVSSVKVMAGEIDVTSNYKVNYQSAAGTLTVTKRPILCVTGDANKPFDGTALSCTDYSINENAYYMGLVKGHTAKVVSNNEITEFGTVDNILEIEIYDENNNNVTSNYDIDYEYGKLEVTKMKIDITTPSEYMVYNGTTLHNSSWDYKNGSNQILGDHSIKVEKYASLSTTGRVKNEVILKVYDSYNKDVTYNYEINYEYGELVINSNTIKVKTPSASKVYDGIPLEALNYGVEGIYGGFTVIETEQTSLTEVGKIDNIVKIKLVDGNNKDVTSNFEILYEYGKLEVTKQIIYIDLISASKVYDGTPLTSNEWVYSSKNITSLLPGATLNLTTTGSITEFGEVDNDVLDWNVIYNGKVVTSCYDIVFNSAKLSISKRYVTIKAIDETKEYDGKSLNSKGYIITSGSLANHEKIEIISTDGTITDVGEIINNITNWTVFNKDGKEVKGSYDIVTTPGTLKITPRVVNITIVDKVKEYDGKELISSEWVYDVNSNKIIEDDSKLVLDMSGSLLVAGTVTNNVEDWNLTIGSKDYSGNYDINFTPGTLEVIKRTVNIKLNDKTQVYNGEELKLGESDFTLLNSSELLPGDVLKIIASGSVTNVDDNQTVKMTGYTIYNKLGQDVTEAYTVIAEDATLSITPAEIHITITDAAKIYDGIPLTSSEWEYTVGYSNKFKQVEIENLELEMTGSIITYGTVQNTVKSYKFIVDGKDYAVNYNIKATAGNLKILPKNIAIKIKDATKVYDGKPLTSSDFEYITDINDLVENDRLEIKTTGSITNVFDTNVLNEMKSFKVYDKYGNDITTSYIVEATPGNLSITKRDITIETKSGTKVYDGFGYFNINSSYEDVFTTNSINDFGEEIRISKEDLNLNIINVGTYNNESIAKIYANDFETTGNYNISYTKGVITIVVREITVYTKNGSKVYDGLPYYSENGTYNNEDFINMDSPIDLVKGETIKVSWYRTDIINVNTAELNKNEIGVEIYKEDGTTLSTTNYKVNIEKGTISIIPKELVIRTKTDSIEYNALPYYGESISIEEVLIGNPYVELKSGKEYISLLSNSHDKEMINVGSYINGIGIEIFKENGENSFSNYDIKYEFGYIHITKKDITIVTLGGAKVYDAKPYHKEILSYNEIVSGNPYVRLNSGIIETFELVKGSHKSIIDVGTYANEVKIDIYKEDGITLSTDNYNIKYTYQDIVIYPITVILKIKDIEREYDGTELTSNEIECVSGNFIQDISYFACETSGKITYAGNVPNTYINGSASLIVDGKDHIKNYNITIQSGTLTIIKKHVTIQIDNKTKVYDGTVLESNKFTEINKLIEGDVLQIETDGKVTYVAEGIVSNNMKDNWKVFNKDGVNVTDSYDISAIPGTLEVYKKELVITSVTASKVYDGTPYYGDNVELKDAITNNPVIDLGDVLEYIELSNWDKSFINVKLDGQTVVSYDNNVEVKIVDANGNDTTENYDIDYESKKGKITINKKSITITTKTNSKVYNGLPYYDENSKFADFINGDDYIQLRDSKETIFVDMTSYNKDIIDVKLEGNNVVGYDNELKVIIKKVNGTLSTDNYNITYVNGKITINKKQIDIFRANGTKVYDGFSYFTNDSDLSKFIQNEKYITLENSKEEIKVDFTKLDLNEIIDVNQYDNKTEIVIVKQNGNDSTHNYDIKYVEAKINITKKEIVLETKADITKVYDGLPLFDENTTLEELLVDITNTDINKVTPNEYEIVFTDSNGDKQKEYIRIEYLDLEMINVKKYDHAWISLSIIKRDGETISNDNYDIKFKVNPVNITHKEITVVTMDGYKVYDSEAYFNSDSLFEDIIDTSQTNRVIELGELTEEMEVASVSDFIYARTHLNDAQVNIFKLNEEGIKIYTTDNYKITYVKGNIVIDKREITIQANDSKVYDGEYFSSNKVDVIVGELAGNDKLTVITSSVENPIKYVKESTTNVINEYFIEREGDFEAVNSYIVTKVDGNITIDAKNVSIKLDDKEKTYDGLELSSSDWSYITGLVVEGKDAVKLEIEGSITDYNEAVATNPDYYNNIIKDIKVEVGSEDLTDNYNFELINGKLIINPIEIEIRTKDGEKTYDGLPYYTEKNKFNDFVHNINDKVELESGIETIKIGSFVNMVDYVYGGYKNEIQLMVYKPDGETISTNNYKFTVISGTIHINKKKLIVETYDVEKTYDGKSYYNADSKFDDIVSNLTSELVINEEITEYIKINKYSEETFVGTYSNFVELEITKSDMLTPSTNNYEFEYKFGEIKILKRDIMIYTPDVEKTYDGTKYYTTLPEVDCLTIAGELAENEYIEILKTSEISFAGKYENLIDFRIVNSITNLDVTINYNLTEDTVIYGDYLINKADLFITTASAEFEYDGTEKSKSNPEDIRIEGLAAGQTYIIVKSAFITAPGKVKNEFEFEIYDVQGELVNLNNYMIEEKNCDYGYLEMYANLLIKTNDKSKVFDGTVMSFDFEKDITVNVNGLNEMPEGHTLNITKTPTLLLCGEEEFTIEYKIVDNNGNDITNQGYYRLNPVDTGKIKITKVSVSLKVRNHAVYYTGYSQQIDDISVQVTGLTGMKTGYRLEYDYYVDETCIDVGEYAESIFIESAKIFINTSSGELDVTNCIDCIGMTAGKLIIRKIGIIVIADDKTKEFDGTELTCNTFHYQGILADGHWIECSIVGSITMFGETDNIVEYVIIRDSYGNDVSSNYNISTRSGKLKITV